MVDPKILGLFGPAFELIREEVEGIDTTLTQLAKLSTDASYQVHEGVGKLTDLIDHQSGLLTLFGEQIRQLSAEESCGLSEDSREELQQELSTLMENGKLLSAYMGQVLRSLQAADMMNQLVDHCRPGMAQIVEAGKQMESVGDEHVSIEMLQQTLEQMLADSKARLHNDELRPVHQDSVDEGDIEFF